MLVCLRAKRLLTATMTASALKSDSPAREQTSQKLIILLLRVANSIRFFIRGIGASCYKYFFELHRRFAELKDHIQ